jgi:hypothetical protein
MTSSFQTRNYSPFMITFPHHMLLHKVRSWSGVIKYFKNQQQLTPSASPVTFMDSYTMEEIGSSTYQAGQGPINREKHSINRTWAHKQEVALNKQDMGPQTGKSIHQAAHGPKNTEHFAHYHFESSLWHSQYSN